MRVELAHELAQISLRNARQKGDCANSPLPKGEGGNELAQTIALTPISRVELAHELAQLAQSGKAA